MCGAGAVPALMAQQARQHGWRVVAFAFAPPSAAVLGDVARVVPCDMREIGPVVATLLEEKVSGVLLSGKFWMSDLLHAERVDETHRAMAARAGSLLDGNIKTVLLSTLTGMGIELLDQRPFLGDGLPDQRLLGARTPSDAEWTDVRRGLEVGRAVATLSIGQTVVVRRGAVGAVEAIEGTTAARSEEHTLNSSHLVISYAVFCL